MTKWRNISRKGIATYFNEEYEFREDVKRYKHQITKLSGSTKEIINLYMSSQASYSQVLDDVKGVFRQTKKTVLVGDLKSLLY